MAATFPDHNSFAIAVSFFIVLCLYFLPSIVGAGRKVPDLGTVLVINVFLGWTIIGWIAALALAARTAIPKVEVAGSSQPPALPSMPTAANSARERSVPPPGWHRQTPEGPVRWWTGAEWGHWYAGDQPSGPMPSDGQ